MEDIKQLAEAAMAEHGLIWLEPPDWHEPTVTTALKGDAQMISGRLGSQYSTTSAWIGPFYREEMFWEVTYLAVLLKDWNGEIALSA